MARLVFGPLTLLPFVSEITVQGMSAGVWTLVGTCVRIPCEVLKQKASNATIHECFRRSERRHNEWAKTTILWNRRNAHERNSVLYDWYDRL